MPPYFDQLHLKEATKSTYITGKRGCGKTMLLKYFDYHTAFSPRRPDIPAEEIRHVGIYWRVDTQFCSSMKHRGISEDEWGVVFDGYFGLVVAVELIRAAKAIAISNYPHFDLPQFSQLVLPSAADFIPDFPTGASELMARLEKARRAFSTWVSNVHAIPRPVLPPGRDFIAALADDLRATPGLAELCVHVYVDEIENLTSYQRRVLNSFLKHSQRPLIVNFTSKEHPTDNQTSGPEPINATHDYRLLDLDKLLLPSARPVFFAEVFLANLDIASGEPDSDLLETVRSASRLTDRLDRQYQERILQTMRERFPTKTEKEFAADAVSDDRIRGKLHERIEKALRQRSTKLSPDDFLTAQDLPEALVVIPALLNRRTLSPEKVLQELQVYRHDGSGSFATTWIHNNLFGALLELYRPYGRECPLYSGFDTLCTMANNNLRNFLILCYKTLDVAELRDHPDVTYPVQIQCRAAYDAADQLIREIKTFGTSGEQLRGFALRLGSVFRALQANPALSEPEQNQITINSGARALTADERAFISELLKYAILVEQLETKTKGSVGQDIVDYQLNPIYAPYFQISYRRKRKIEMTVEQFHTLAMGTEGEFRELAKSFARHLPETETLQLGLL
ncbi:KAP family P-loop domain-containing protein (plasmid) [Cupriavidus sp. H19C3]